MVNKYWIMLLSYLFVSAAYAGYVVIYEADYHPDSVIHIYLHVDDEVASHTTVSPTALGGGIRLGDTTYAINLYGKATAPLYNGDLHFYFVGEEYVGQEDPTVIDTDDDGIPDDEDPDDDGDGLPDDEDPDPLNPDIDDDGIPDGQDTDIDGDGKPDNVQVSFETWSVHIRNPYADPFTVKVVDVFTGQIYSWHEIPLGGKTIQVVVESGTSWYVQFPAGYAAPELTSDPTLLSDGGSGTNGTSNATDPTSSEDPPDNTGVEGMDRQEFQDAIAGGIAQAKNNLQDAVTDGLKAVPEINVKIDNASSPIIEEGVRAGTDGFIEALDDIADNTDELSALEDIEQAIESQNLAINLPTNQLSITLSNDSSTAESYSAVLGSINSNVSLMARFLRGAGGGELVVGLGSNYVHGLSGTNYSQYVIEEGTNTNDLNSATNRIDKSNALLDFVDDWFGAFFTLNLPETIGQQSTMTFILPAAGGPDGLKIWPDSIDVDLYDFSGIAIVRHIEEFALHIVGLFFCAHIIKETFV